MLGECVSEKNLPAGDQVFHEDEPAGDLYVLERGTLKIRRMTPFGEYELLVPPTGSLFGEDGFLTGAPREADADCVTASKLLVLSAGTLAAACEKDQRFELALHWSLWKGLSQKLRVANDRLARIFSTDSAPPNLPTDAPSTAHGEADMDMAHKIGLFREQRLSAMEINFLASLSREETFLAGEAIFREGEAGEKMYVVADGTVMISKTIPGVGEEALAFLERGDYFGEMALIDHRPRSADARAHPTSEVTVLALPRAVVEGLLNIEKLSSVRLLKILTSLAAKRTREIQEKLVGWFLLAGGDIDPTPGPSPLAKAASSTLATSDEWGS